MFFNLKHVPVDSVSFDTIQKQKSANCEAPTSAGYKATISSGDKALVMAKFEELMSHSDGLDHQGQVA